MEDREKKDLDTVTELGWDPFMVISNLLVIFFYTTIFHDFLSSFFNTYNCYTIDPTPWFRDKKIVCTICLYKKDRTYHLRFPILLFVQWR